MGVYKEGKNWKVQVYYKDWQGNQKRKQKRGFRMIIPVLFEPPVRTLRATIPENESHIFR